MSKFWYHKRKEKTLECTSEGCILIIKIIILIIILLLLSFTYYFILALFSHYISFDGKYFLGHVFCFSNCLWWMQRRHKSQYLQEDNVWQKIWDKVRFYWEHIMKHIDNLGNTLGTHWEHDGNTTKNTLGTHWERDGNRTKNTLGTHWEHDGNTTKKHIGNQKNLKNPFFFLPLSLSPLPKKKSKGGKKIGSIGHMLQFFIGSAEISIWNITYFGIGKWQGLELWAHSSQICNQPH